MNQTESPSPFFRKQLIQQAITTLIGEINARFFDEIYTQLEWVELKSRDILFYENDAADGLYILVHGKLQALIHENDRQVKVGEIVPGESVGEVAIFTGEPRNATIKAVRDSVLVKISKTTFIAISREHPDIILNIAKLIMLRLSNANRNIRKQTGSNKNIAIIPLGRVPLLARFGHLLLDSLKKYQKTDHLTSTMVDQLLDSTEISQSKPDNTEAQEKMNALIHHHEMSCEKLLLVGDDTSTEWTRRCLSQADLIMLIIDASQTPGVFEMDNLLQGENRITDASVLAIFLHDDQLIYPVNTKKWFTHLPGKRLFHARLHPRYIDRVSRFLTHKSVGLTLAGGGARGAAHLGVFKALLEHKIPIDMVGGTSMGALMAGGVALDTGADELIMGARERFLANPVNDYNLLPVMSFLRGKKMEKMVAGYFGDLDIEDLWLPYFCVSSNMSKSKEYHHYRGNVTKAVMASMAIPGVFPPVMYDGDFHVDGGIFNNLPIDVMHQFGAGVNIGVNMNEDNGFSSDSEQTPSDWDVLKNKWMFKKKKGNRVPTLMSSIMHSITLSSDSNAQANKKFADLYINLVLHQYGMMEVKAFDELVNTGYDQTMRALELNPPDFIPE